MNKTDIFKDKISVLPEFEPEANLWGRIEAELDFDLNMKRAIAGLPTFDPEDRLWDEINPKIQKPNNYIPFIVKWSAMAASVAIVVSLSVLLYHTHSQSKIIVETEIVSEEISSEWPQPSLTEIKAIQMIEQLCQSDKSVCDNQSFKEKIDLYHELELEEAQLGNAIKSIGESPEMVKALIRIENMKSKTIQELITLMNV